jgi:hypothetical protein
VLTLVAEVIEATDPEMALLTKTVGALVRPDPVRR